MADSTEPTVITTASETCTPGCLSGTVEWTLAPEVNQALDAMPPEERAEHEELLERLIHAFAGLIGTATTYRTDPGGEMAVKAATLMFIQNVASMSETLREIGAIGMLLAADGTGAIGEMLGIPTEGFRSPDAPSQPFGTSGYYGGMSAQKPAADRPKFGFSAD